MTTLFIRANFPIGRNNNPHSEFSGDDEGFEIDDRRMRFVAQ